MCFFFSIGLQIIFSPLKYSFGKSERNEDIYLVIYK